MFSRRVSVCIARPLEDVYTFVEDARNRPLWDDSVDSKELTSPEPIGVGSTVRTKLHSMARPALTGRSATAARRRRGGGAPAPTTAR
jgi:hypothetical protein